MLCLSNSVPLKKFPLLCLQVFFNFSLFCSVLALTKVFIELQYHALIGCKYRFYCDTICDDKYLWSIVSQPRLLSKCKHFPQSDPVHPSITSMWELTRFQTLWGAPTKMFAQFSTNYVLIYNLYPKPIEFLKWTQSSIN